MCYFRLLFMSCFFVGDVVFYERDGNDINRPLVY